MDFARQGVDYQIDEWGEVTAYIDAAWKLDVVVLSARTASKDSLGDVVLAPLPDEPTTWRGTLSIGDHPVEEVDTLWLERIGFKD